MSDPDRILLVEDDRTIAVTYGTYLVAAGYAVRIAKDGLAALDDLAAFAPSLVVLDLQLPHISGFRLLQIIKRASSRVPVLIATSLAFEEAEEVARAKADDFLTKPIEPETLLAKVAYHLLHRDHASSLATSDLGARSRRGVPPNLDRSSLPRPDDAGLMRSNNALDFREQFVTLAGSGPCVRRRAERALQTVGD